MPRTADAGRSASPGPGPALGRAADASRQSAGASSPPSDWTTSGTLTGISFGTPMLGATFEKLDVELPFTETSGTISRAYLLFRSVLSPADVRTTLDLWPIRPAAGDQAQYGTMTALYGCCLFATAGTQYEILAYIQDVLGFWAQVYLGTVTTRAESEIPDASTLTPTRYVGAGGSDAANGLTSGTRWLTFDMAMQTAPSGAVVQLAPGYYGPAVHPTNGGSYTRFSPITIKAQFPAVDSGGKNGAAINSGNWSVIEPRLVSAPTGTTAWTSAISSNPYTVAPWVAVQLQGTGQTLIGGTFASPTTPRWHGGNGTTPDGTLWKWTAPPFIDQNAQQTAQLGYATTRDGDPQKVPWVNGDSGVMATPGGWAEIMYTNTGYNDSGVYQDFSDGSIYLKLPAHAPSLNPNTLWIKAGGDVPAPVQFGSNDCRLTGAVVHAAAYGVQTTHGTGRAVVDHVRFSCMNNCIRWGSGGSGQSLPTQNLSLYAHDNVAQYCIMNDSNLWSRDYQVIPWRMYKGTAWLENDIYYAAAGGYTGAGTRWSLSENTALGSRGGSVRCVHRYNRTVGFVNGFSGVGSSSGECRYAGYGNECHDNYWAELSDDVFELDTLGISQAIWNETVRHGLVLLSLGPHDLGPVYVLFCDVFDLTKWGVGYWNWDRPVPEGGNGSLGDGQGIGAVIVKHSGGSTPKCLTYMLHTTVWGNTSEFWGPAEIASPTGSDEEGFYLRNNIWRTTGYTYRKTSTQTPWSEDYNLAISAWLWGAYYDGVTHHTQANWRSSTGQGAHSNIINGVTLSSIDDAAPLDAILEDPANGDLRVKVANQDQVVGVVLPGINDALGRTPRMGYQP